MSETQKAYNLPDLLRRLEVLEEWLRAEGMTGTVTSPTLVGEARAALSLQDRYWQTCENDLAAAQSTLEQAERDIVALHALLRAHEDDKVRLRQVIESSQHMADHQCERAALAEAQLREAYKYAGPSRAASSTRPDSPDRRRKG